MRAAGAVDRDLAHAFATESLAGQLVGAGVRAFGEVLGCAGRGRSGRLSALPPSAT